MTKMPVAEPSLGNKELNNVVEAVKSGWISSIGKFIGRFEQKFARYCNFKYGVATSNGTAALHLSLAALGIKEDDEVIVPVLTFIATANVVRYVGAKPVFVDIHPDYWCIDPEKIEEKITSKTKAIIPVHLYGHPCDIDPILKIAKKYNLFVIEDAAEAHGAEYKGEKVGSFGDISCFSFYGNKIITTGEGGMCVTNNKKLAEEMIILRDHGMNPRKRYWYDVIGFNYRMTNMQAALGMAQLERIDQFIKKKREIAKWYEGELKELVKKKLIILHPEMSWAKCVYWMYSILVENKFNLSRNQLMDELGNRGIGTRPFFYPIHFMPPYKKLAIDKYPIAVDLAKRGINLPSSMTLKKNEVSFIASIIKTASKK